MMRRMPRIGIHTIFGLTFAAAAAAQAPETAEFRNANGTFHLDLPTGWRQLAPNEARTVGALPGAPKELGYVEPRRFYAVGPVDRWLQGDFGGAWLWVVEQDNEWEVEDDFADELARMWREKGDIAGVQHELADVGQHPVGTQQRVSIIAVRTSTPRTGPATRSLDVHCPSGGQQISLSFVCPIAAWDVWEPRFRGWLTTLTFARQAREERSVGDRLWTPLVTGGIVSLVLLALYKHTRRRS